MSCCGIRSEMRAGNTENCIRARCLNAYQLELTDPPNRPHAQPSYTLRAAPGAPLQTVAPKRKCQAYTGIARFVSHFAEPGAPDYAPVVMKQDTRAEKKARIEMNKLEQGASKVAEELQKYDPKRNPNATGDPYKTLFVAKLNYETSEQQIKHQFEVYGPIKRWCVHVVTDTHKNKPRGYAFVEYMHTQDMRRACKLADGMEVDGKRVLVDFERGRTVPNWRPRRLGGGLGSSRIGGGDAEKDFTGEQQHVGRHRPDEPWRDECRADRDLDKSHERVLLKRDRDKRTHERSHDVTHDHDSGDHAITRQGMLWDKDWDHSYDHHSTRGRDCDRDYERDRDHDSGDRAKTRQGMLWDKEYSRHRGHDGDRDKDFDRHHGERDRDHSYHHRSIRGRDRDRDYERASYEHDHDTHDRHRDRDHGWYRYRERNHDCSHDHHRKRGRDRDRDYQRNSHEHDCDGPEKDRDRGSGQHYHRERDRDRSHDRHHRKRRGHDRHYEHTSPERDCDDHDKDRDRGYDQYYHRERDSDRHHKRGRDRS
ncbi:hypothetical protein ACP4OV_015770 [Aristida adscensionis]